MTDTLNPHDDEIELAPDWPESPNNTVATMSYKYTIPSDTLTQRVAEAIEKLGVSETDALDFAKAAIEASGAQHLQGLVEAVIMAQAYISYVKEKDFNLHKEADGSPSIKNILRETLAALPEEVRGEG